MRIYRIYGAYSSNHFVRISYAAYVKLLFMRGITISKKLYGDPTFGQPQTKQGWIDNTMEPLHDAKKEHFGKQRKRFYCRNHKEYLPSNMRENKLPRDILRNHGSTGQLSSPSRYPRKLPGSSSHQKVHEETAGILRRKTRPSTPSTIQRTRCLQAAWLRKNKRFPAHRWWILQHNIT